MKAKVIIERGVDGTYSAYIATDNVPYGIIGEGNSVSETIEDFKAGYEEMRDSYALDGKEFPECDFEYIYDVASFLQMYAYAFTLAGLSRITGIAQGQLSHYVTGHRKPSVSTVKRIENSMHAFANEIGNVRFV